MYPTQSTTIAVENHKYMGQEIDMQKNKPGTRTPQNPKGPCRNFTCGPPPQPHSPPPQSGWFFVISVYGRTPQNLLGALENSHGEHEGALDLEKNYYLVPC